MSLVRVEEFKGHTITVFLETDPSNPRDFDNLGTMIAFHRKYDLGDSTKLRPSDFNTWAEMEVFLRKHLDAAIVLPLSLVDHSGISLSVGVAKGWDCGQVGFIYITREKILAEWKRKRLNKKLLASVESILNKEVNIYDQYLRGNIYSYVICGPKNISSLGDMLMPLDDVIKEAQEFIDNSL